MFMTPKGDFHTQMIGSAFFRKNNYNHEKDNKTKILILKWYDKS